MKVVNNFLNLFFKTNPMNFLKTFLASLLGSFVAIVILFFITIGIIAGIVAIVSSDDVTIKGKTLLVMELDKPVMDRAPKMPLLYDLGSTGKATGLNDILKNIRKAKTDDRISGILLELSDIPSGISTVSEIRQALQDFRLSGKFIYAYGEYYSQTAYYLASVADSVFINPEGSLLFKGLNSELIFLKGLLEKIDVKVQIVRHGKFKAATEPLFLDKMSAENREQISLIVERVWDHMLTGISESRTIGKDKLNAIADSLLLNTADDVIRYRLADRMVYKDQLLASLRKVMELPEKKKIPVVTLDEYNNVKTVDSLHTGAKESVAVIYAEGAIGPGEGDDQSIGSDRISKAIRQAREESKVKAIVFRINSGGGSALASDVIWREVVLASREKPVIASFGDVAASGGYYIACGATKILADPSTITGSIGVWGAIPNMQGLFNNKLGITFDDAGSNKNSDFIPVTKPVSPYQLAVLQKSVDHVYEVFIGKVADGRKMEKTSVDSVGEGRIWSGTDALRLGLIDEYGGLDKAIRMAADLAKLEKYKLMELPRQKDPIEQILEEIMGNASLSPLKEALGDDYHLVEMVREARTIKGVQARIPFYIKMY